MIFEDTFQSNFCFVEYEAYDDNVNFYETIKENWKHSLNFVMSIIYKLFENETSISVETVLSDALYNEESEFNKRFHQKQIAFESIESIIASIDWVIKKKSTKRVEKKSESQSLMNMFDDALKVYEKLISMR